LKFNLKKPYHHDGCLCLPVLLGLRLSYAHSNSVSEKSLAWSRSFLDRYRDREWANTKITAKRDSVFGRLTLEKYKFDNELTTGAWQRGSVGSSFSVGKGLFGGKTLKKGWCFWGKVGAWSGN